MRPKAGKPGLETPIYLSELKILIVEDNALNQTVIGAMVKATGASFSLAVNGKEAVSTMEAAAFDLVLMDIQMPEMNGIDATRAIRQLPGDKSLVPIVAVTANAHETDKEMCLAAGMNAFIPKPVDIELFYQTINDIAATCLGSERKSRSG